MRVNLSCHECVLVTTHESEEAARQGDLLNPGCQHLEHISPQTALWDIQGILTSRTEGKEGLGVRPKEETEVKSRVIDDTMWCLLRDKSKCKKDMGERENVLISTTKSKQNRWAKFGNKGTWNPFKLKYTLTQKSAHEYKERLSPVCLVSLLRKEEVKKSPF